MVVECYHINVLSAVTQAETNHLLLLLSFLYHISMSHVISHWYAPLISQAYHPKLSTAEASIDFHQCIHTHCHLSTFVNTAVSINIQMSTHPECAHAFSPSSSSILFSPTHL